MLWLIIMVLAVLAIGGVVSLVKDSQEMRQTVSRNQVYKSAFDNAILEWESKYGECPQIFDMRQYLFDEPITSNNQIVFFDKSNIVIIDGSAVQYDRIMTYKVSDNGYDVITGSTKISTGSMAGRALVGGVLLGGVGALAGAATAKRETVEEVETIHDFVIKIYIRGDDNTPKIYQVGDNQRKVDELTDYLDYIIMSRENPK